MKNVQYFYLWGSFADQTKLFLDTKNSRPVLQKFIQLLSLRSSDIFKSLSSFVFTFKLSKLSCVGLLFHFVDCIKNIVLLIFDYL